MHIFYQNVLVSKVVVSLSLFNSAPKWLKAQYVTNSSHQTLTYSYVLEKVKRKVWLIHNIVIFLVIFETDDTSETKINIKNKK